MEREFPLAPFTVIGGPKRSLPLKEILIRLNQVYCGHLGLEYTYINDLNVVGVVEEVVAEYRLGSRYGHSGCFTLSEKLWKRSCGKQIKRFCRYICFIFFNNNLLN